MKIPLRRYFTLIELLVVVSIIAILASMLLPVSWYAVQVESNGLILWGC